jgi:hypothetical protein
MAYPDYGTFPKYGGGGSFPESTKVAATTDTGYREYSSSGRLFLPASTNYCTNPSFEIDTDSNGLSDTWAEYENSGASSTLTRVAGRTGGYAQRVQMTADGADSGKIWEIYINSPAASFASGDISTWSCYLKGTTTGTVQVRLGTTTRTNAEADIHTTYSSDITLSSSWTRVSLTDAAAGATTDHINVFLLVSGLDSGDSFDITIDDVLIEKSSFLTPYFDGSSPDCSWSGTANASTSVRALSVMRMATSFTTMPEEVTIAARVIPLASQAQAGTDPLFSLWVNNTTRAFMRHNYGSLRFANSGEQNVAGGGFAALSKNTIVGRWDANGQDFRWNATDATRLAVAPLIASVTEFRIAEVLGVNLQGVYLSEVVLCPSRITDAETALLSTLLTTCNGAELYKFFYDRGYYGTLIIPLEGDASAYIVGGGSTVRDNYTFSTVAATTDTGYEVYDA